MTGLCTQANNGLLVEDAAVAGAYKDAWDRIHRAGSAYPPSLAKANSIARSFTVDQSAVSFWNAPTDAQEDMDQARKLINNAKEGVLFLMFNPGGFQDDPGAGRFCKASSTGTNPTPIPTTIRRSTSTASSTSRSRAWRKTRRSRQKKTARLLLTN